MKQAWYTIMIGSQGDRYPARYPTRDKAEQAARNLRLLGYETLVTNHPGK